MFIGQLPEFVQRDSEALRRCALEGDLQSLAQLLYVSFTWWLSRVVSDVVCWGFFFPRRRGFFLFVYGCA
jgi:hypothetical protein